MGLHRIRKGLDLPLCGAPRQDISTGRPVSRVAVLGQDYLGMRPALHVAVGDRVSRGQLLFEDKRTPGLRYTAPGAGIVAAIHRGERRVLQSVVIELDEAERSGEEDAVEEVRYETYTGKSPSALSREEIRGLLLESGLWTAFRTRPFSKVPRWDSAPHSIFVTAMDTNPLAASVEMALMSRETEFEEGLLAVAQLTDGPTYLCKRAGAHIPVPSLTGTQISVEEFEGPHPSGTPGVHIHLLDPVYRDKVVWHLNYQDVAAIGRLVSTGRQTFERVISLAGPGVKHPRLLRTRIGACLDELVHGELTDGELRVISGSVLSGRTAGGERVGYLGRYHLQVSVIQEERSREFLGWIMPAWHKFSVVGVVASKLFRGRRLALTTSLNGSKRAMVPIGLYERVMPMDLLPTFLLRALLVGDVERAEQLGCLELDEEDVALCTCVCPCKQEYGQALRAVLDSIEKEG